jgi:AraC family transcriptional regulator, regulatory protein of adaptative response / DNA-3-methyladenine glycosylase II
MTMIAGLDHRALDRARISRDSRFDGRFFIAVTSTRIYCRPICPVRSPKPAHIRYFATAAAAAAAGFRPCLRCRPEAAPGTPAWDGTSAIVRRALRLIDAGALDDGAVDDLAATVGIGSRHLHRLFMQFVGAPPIAVAQTRRLHFAKRLIDETTLPMTEIAIASGFGSVRRFNATFRQVFGRAPRDLRRRRALRSEDVVLTLAYRPPYDWEHLCGFLATRAIAGVECVDDRGYGRTVATGDGNAIIWVKPIAGEHALQLRVGGATPASLFEISSTARRIFDLAADPMRVAGAFAGDPLLAPLIARRPGMRVVGAWDPFECAVRAILGQQVSVAAGRTLAARIVARIGRPADRVDRGLTHLFPSPAAMADADLDGLGLTTMRAATVRALARAVVDGAIDFTWPPADVERSLMALPGIGAWTAQYVALRALGDPDAFPASDLVLRRVAAGGAEVPLGASALELRAEAWRPWRGYAVFHLWGASSDRRADARLKPRATEDGRSATL